jgi:tetratricopeptide (TPR) repeat protein
VEPAPARVEPARAPEEPPPPAPAPRDDEWLALDLDPEPASIVEAPPPAPPRRERSDDAADVERYLDAHPRDIAALEKLIEIHVDGARADAACDAEHRLAEACLAEARYEQARAIALDLCVRHPEIALHRELVDRITCAARDRGCALPPLPPLDLLCAFEPPDEATRETVCSTRLQPRRDELQPRRDEPEGSYYREGAAETPAPAIEPDADQEVRQALLEDAATAAEERFAEAARLTDAGNLDGAASALEAAMCVPHLRVPAGSRLARLHRDRGAAAEALSCLEWVAEVPPPTEESGHELAYELALTLEALGLHREALGVYRELLAVVGPRYRDIGRRVDQLVAA